MLGFGIPVLPLKQHYNLNNILSLEYYSKFYISVFQLETTFQLQQCAKMRNFATILMKCNSIFPSKIQTRKKIREELQMLLKVWGRCLSRARLGRLLGRLENHPRMSLKSNFLLLALHELPFLLFSHGELRSHHSLSRRRSCKLRSCHPT